MHKGEPLRGQQLVVFQINEEQDRKMMYLIFTQVDFHEILNYLILGARHMKVTE